MQVGSKDGDDGLLFKPTATRHNLLSHDYPAIPLRYVLRFTPAGTSAGTASVTVRGGTCPRRSRPQ